MTGTPAPEFSIQPAVKSHRAAWAAMRASLWPDASPAELDREVAGHLAGTGIHGIDAAFLALRPDGSAIGFIELSIRSHAEGCETDRVAYVEGWYVDPAWRRRQVGRALVRAAEAWARARGCAELASDTEADNRLSQAAHRALGFASTGRIVTFMKRVNG